MSPSYWFGPVEKMSQSPLFGLNPERTKSDFGVIFELRSGYRFIIFYQILMTFYVNLCLCARFMGN
jgi:hypothetical protein